MSQTSRKHYFSAIMFLLVAVVCVGCANKQMENSTQNTNNKKQKVIQADKTDTRIKVDDIKEQYAYNYKFQDNAEISLTSVKQDDTTYCLLEYQNDNNTEKKEFGLDAGGFKVKGIDQTVFGYNAFWLIYGKNEDNRALCLVVDGTMKILWRESEKTGEGPYFVHEDSEIYDIDKDGNMDIVHSSVDDELFVYKKAKNDTIQKGSLAELLGADVKNYTFGKDVDMYLDKEEHQIIASYRDDKCNWKHKKYKLDQLEQLHMQEYNMEALNKENLSTTNTKITDAPKNTSAMLKKISKDDSKDTAANEARLYKFVYADGTGIDMVSQVTPDQTECKIQYSKDNKTEETALKLDEGYFEVRGITEKVLGYNGFWLTYGEFEENRALCLLVDHQMQVLWNGSEPSEVFPYYLTENDVLYDFDKDGNKEVAFSSPTGDIEYYRLNENNKIEKGVFSDLFDVKKEKYKPRKSGVPAVMSFDRDKNKILAEYVDSKGKWKKCTYDTSDLQRVSMKEYSPLKLSENTFKK